MARSQFDDSTPKMVNVYLQRVAENRMKNKFLAVKRLGHAVQPLVTANSEDTEGGIWIIFTSGG